MTDQTATRFVHNAGEALDPLGDLDQEREANRNHNRAKVGSSRPSSLLYTYGPAAIMDLPNFTVMPAGLDEWERIYARRDTADEPIHAPRLRDAVRKLLNSSNLQLRAFPWQPKRSSHSKEGDDLGVPSIVFPQWLRCTTCGFLGILSQFEYTNTNPYRTDKAEFAHRNCPGRRGHRPDKPQPASPARYLLACPEGHLDEFPYEPWVHRGQQCAVAPNPHLRMTDRTSGRGASAVVECVSCGKSRGMNEAQGQAGEDKLPPCRGRHPHLDAFETGGCGARVKLMLIGASNLWFPAVESIIVMPETREEERQELVEQVRLKLGALLGTVKDQLPVAKELLVAKGVDVSGLGDAELQAVLDAASEAPTEPSVEEWVEELKNWDPVDLLVPEWQYLQNDPPVLRHEDPASGLVLSRRERGPELRSEVERVLAIEKLRKANALYGFTRIDAIDRVDDPTRRLAPLSRRDRPQWTVATIDQGEGFFLQLDDRRVAEWERRVENSDVWTAHKIAHRNNFDNRYSDTAKKVNPDERLRPPRYWLVHTLAHVLIRECALYCGYAAASLSERLYAWRETDSRPAAAGLIICTTAPDSDGTLGGLVQLSAPDKFQMLLNRALYRAGRCSSDPVCALRLPREPEDFLHGAACHCCVMASETSCERANRFLDRRFLIDLPGGDGLGFFPWTR